MNEHDKRAAFVVKLLANMTAKQERIMRMVYQINVQKMSKASIYKNLFMSRKKFNYLHDKTIRKCNYPIRFQWYNEFLQSLKPHQHQTSSYKEFLNSRSDF